MPSIYGAMCKFMGRCSADNTSGLHIVLNRPDDWEWPGYVDEAISCLAEGQMVGKDRCSCNAPGMLQFIVRLIGQP